MKLEVDKMLTVSSSHITEDIARELDDVVEWGNSGIFDQFSVYHKSEYGWFLYIPNDLELTEVNEVLRPLVQLAVENDCKILCIDCDGQIIEELPTYDW